MQLSSSDKASLHLQHLKRFAKFFILSASLLQPILCYANTCSRYFKVPYITQVKDLSADQYLIAKSLALRELEIRNLQHPISRNIELLTLMDQLKQLLETGVDIQAYYDVRNIVAKEEFSKKISISETIEKQELEFIKFEIEKELLERHASPDLTEALSNAFLKYQPEDQILIHKVLKHPALLKKLDFAAKVSIQESTLLFSASMRGNMEAIKTFLDLGSDIDSLNTQEKLTPLQIAAKFNQEQAVQFLLDNRANIEIGEFTTGTALHFAANNLNSKIIEILLDHKANIEAKNNENQTPLHVLVERFNNPKILPALQTLLNRKAATDVRDHKGFTPLHVAAVYGSVVGLQTLIDSGVEINVRDLEGRTPLYLAAMNQYIDAVNALLQHKADPTLADNQNKTPLQLAIEHVNPELEALLREHGATE